MAAPAALSKISEEEAGTKESPAKWSRKQELGHLIDSALNNHRRLVLGQIEDNPPLQSYNGVGWVAINGYQSRGWTELIRSWRAFNEWLLSVAERVPEAEWKRTLQLAEGGEVTLQYIIDDYVDHMRSHLEHIGIGAALDGSTLGSPGTGVSYPEKPALAEAPIAELLARRWSPAAFDVTHRVEKDKILSLIEAARWAPSCFNEQPWRFLIFDGSDPQALEDARECLSPGNEWAKSAPVLMLSVAAEDFSKDGKPNRHAEYDTGMAGENVVLQAVELGLAAHQMAGYDAARARELFKIPDGYTPMAMIATGYPYHGNLDDLSEKVKARESRPRSRKGVSEIAYNGTWGKGFGAQALKG